MKSAYNFKKLHKLAQELEQLIHQHGADADAVKKFAIKHRDVPGFRKIAVAVARRCLQETKAGT